MASQLAVSNASKDRLIEEMRREIEELRENDKDYADLNFLLTNLESRYGVLNEEKRQQEIEFQDRQDAHVKLIAQLHVEIDTLKESLKGKKAELEKVVCEVTAQREVADITHLNTDRLKNELKQQFDVNQRLREDNQSMDSQLRWHKEEKKNLNDRIDQLSRTVSEMLEKNDDLARMFEESEKDRCSLESLHRELECEFGYLSEELSKKGSCMRELESACDKQLEQLSRQQDQIDRWQQENEDRQKQNSQLNLQYNQIYKQLTEVSTELKVLQCEQIQTKQTEKDLQDKYGNLQREFARNTKDLDVIREERQRFSELNTELTQELNLKHSLLQELQNQAANALQTILRLEQENQDTINDYQWIKAELEDNNAKAKAEINRNIDLVNANRDLEDSLIESERRLTALQCRESELMCKNEELAQQNRRYKNELEDKQGEFKEQKGKVQELEMELQEKRSQLEDMARKEQESFEKWQSSECALKELRGQLRNLGQQSAWKDEKMKEIEMQSQSSVGDLVRLEEEHKKQQRKNERLKEELLEARENLARMEGQSQQAINQLKEDRAREINELEQLHERLRKELQEKNQRLQDTINQLSSKLDQSFQQNTKLQINNDQLSNALEQIQNEDQELNQLIDQKQALRQARLKEEQHLKISLSQLKSTLSAASLQTNRNNAVLYGRSNTAGYEQQQQDYYDSERSVQFSRPNNINDDSNRKTQKRSQNDGIW